MPIVNGNLKDFSVHAAPEVSPQIIFKPSGAGTSGDTFFFSAEIIVTPDNAGNWSQEFASTEDLNPARWYDPYIRWLNGAGGYVDYDFPGFRLYVPLGGPFEFAQIIEAPSNPTQTWFGIQPPVNPTAGTKWIDTGASPDATVNSYRWVD